MIEVKFDSTDNPVQARLILCTRNGSRIREIPMNDVRFHEGINSGSEFSFTVYKEKCVTANGTVDETFWNKIRDFRLAWCPEHDLYYELSMDLTDSVATAKKVTATSLGEAELGQINLHGLEINTEDDIARDDYVPTVFYDENNSSASLIDRLLYKAPHYRIDHVDDSLKEIQRTFQFDGVDAYGAFQEVAKEINCLFFFDCKRGSNGRVDRTVSAYDLEYSCISCGYRDDFMVECPKCGSQAIRPGYGDDTTVYVSKENLASEVTFQTDVASVKNCFRLEGGDDLMTATIINCNPNGSQYMWYITEEMREDMSDELRARLAQYDAQYDYFQNEATYAPPAELLTRYNAIVQEYQSYDENLEEIPAEIVGYPDLMNAYYNTIDLQLFLNNRLMPSVEIESTDAETEAAKLTSAALTPIAVANLSSCSAATAASAVLGMAKCLVRQTFQLKIHDSVYSSETHTWTGTIDVVNYGDEEDTATSESITVVINADMETYINQKIRRLMKQDSDDVTDIHELFELGQAQFEAELDNWCLQRLIAFRESCQAVLDILIQQGVADRNSWASAENDLYTNLYLPYRNKMAAIEAEIEERSSQLAVVTGIYDDNGGILFDGMQSLINERRNGIHELQDFEAYLGTTLWNEFAAYRREDTYSNQNYISDGLSNDELFANALRFLDVAQKEIYASATLQHSISASMSNLLTMREFRPLLNKFRIGNWIRVGVDKRVYRLRLGEYTIDYNGWGLDVSFTDVKYGHSSASDIASLLAQAKNMSTSYGAVTRQAEDGQKSYSRMQNWTAEGFSLTTKIVGGADNQEFLMDSSGFTGREWIPESESYSDEQVKIISHGLYVTDDGWLTAKAGVGRFTYWNPQTQQTESAFGVIADTIVGNIILGQNVGIYNESNSITLDDDGFTLITEAGEGAKVFRILRREQDDSLTNVLCLDQNGHLLLETSGIEDAVSTSVEINNRGLMTQVENRLSEVNTTLTQREDSLEMQVEQNRTDIGTVQTTFRVTSEGAEISKNTSDTTMELSNEQISIKVYGDTVTYWNANEQYMPKMVNIPVGGSLRLGSVQFQPRSNGNLSLLWVGENE